MENIEVDKRNKSDLDRIPHGFIKVIDPNNKLAWANVD